MHIIINIGMPETVSSASIPVENHPLEPFLPANGRLLMLGSFPPPRKRWCMDFYYPNFTNDMWRVFGLVFFGDAQRLVDAECKTYRLAEIKALLNEKGIGLYDTACAVRRLQDNAADKFLEVVTPTDIEALLGKMPCCRAIATTGQKATETLCAHFGVEVPKVGGYVKFMQHGEEFRLYRMPSTSRAYPLALAKKAEAYGKMLAEVMGE